jgi:predicted RND superfamily exporter protein
MAVGAVLAAVGFVLLPSVPVEARPERLAAGLDAIDDARQAEQVLDASGEVSVWVWGGDVLTPRTLEWFREAEAALVVAFGDRLRPIVSPARLLRFLGEDPTSDQIDAALRLLPGYLSAATIRSDQREAVMSFGLRLGDLSRQADLLRAVERRLPAAPDGLTAGVTGLPAVASRAHDLLSDGRVTGNVIGLAAVAAVLLAFLGRPRDALAAGLAAALAFGWGVVVLRLAGTALSPLTVSLGTLTAAVGAEFTVFARERTRAGAPRPWSGVIAAAATSVAGFAALAVSRLELLREFGLVLAGSVLLSLIAARLLTPPSADRELVG